MATVREDTDGAQRGTARRPESTERAHVPRIWDATQALYIVKDIERRLSGLMGTWAIVLFLAVACVRPTKRRSYGLL
jgi:hypothetical protein